MRIYENPLGMRVDDVRAFVADVVGKNKKPVSIPAGDNTITFRREAIPLENDLIVELYTATGVLLFSLLHRMPRTASTGTNPRIWAKSLDHRHALDTLIPSSTKPGVYPQVHIALEPDGREVTDLQFANQVGHTLMENKASPDAKLLKAHMEQVGDAFRQALTGIIQSTIDAGLLPKGKTVGDYITTQTSVKA